MYCKIWSWYTGDGARLQRFVVYVGMYVSWEQATSTQILLRERRRNAMCVNMVDI